MTLPAHIKIKPVIFDLITDKIQLTTLNSESTLMAGLPRALIRTTHSKSLRNTIPCDSQTDFLTATFIHGASWGNRNPLKWSTRNAGGKESPTSISILHFVTSNSSFLGATFCDGLFLKCSKAKERGETGNTGKWFQNGWRRMASLFNEVLVKKSRLLPLRARGELL